MPARLRAILFDLGNTLLFFHGDWQQVFAASDQALLEHLQNTGMVIDSAYFLSEFRERMDTYYRDREGDYLELTTAYILRNVLASMGHPVVPDATLRAALRQMYSVSQQCWLPAADTLPTLQTLQMQGYRMGIISNASDDADVQTLADKTCLRPYFDLILSSAALGVRKPNHAIFEMALARWGLPPGQVAMVGDTLDADICGAQQLGIFSVWITHQADTPANQRARTHIAPNAEITTLGELPDILQ